MHSFLEYWYTKLGRSNPYLWSIDALNIATRNLTGLLADLSPINHRIDSLNTGTPNLVDLLADLTPINWAELPWKLLHQTWQIYWHIYPPSIKNRCLENCYTKLGIFTGRSNPQSIEYRCLENCYTKLGRSTPTPSQLSIDALNTTTLNLADLPPVNISIDALNTATPNLVDLPMNGA